MGLAFNQYHKHIFCFAFCKRLWLTSHIGKAMKASVPVIFLSALYHWSRQECPSERLQPISWKDFWKVWQREMSLQPAVHLLFGLCFKKSYIFLIKPNTIRVNLSTAVLNPDNPKLLCQKWFGGLLDNYVTFCKSVATFPSRMALMSMPSCSSFVMKL